jgi:hypothetical protein
MDCGLGDISRKGLEERSILLGEEEKPLAQALQGATVIMGGIGVCLRVELIVTHSRLK